MSGWVDQVNRKKKQKKCELINILVLDTHAVSAIGHLVKVHGGLLHSSGDDFVLVYQNRTIKLIFHSFV